MFLPLQSLFINILFYYTQQTWGAYLTNWTYVLLTIYFLLHALIALTMYLCCRGTGLSLFGRLEPAQHRFLFHELGNPYSGYEQISSEVDELEVEFTERYKVTCTVLSKV